MILIASLFIRAAIMVWIGMIAAAAVEFDHVAFRGGYCVDDSGRKYVGTNYFGKLSPRSFLILSAISMILFASAIAGLAYLDFQLNS